MGSLVIVGHGLTQDKVKITYQIRIFLVFEPFLSFTQGKRKVRCGIVFELHTFATKFKSCCFHRAFCRISLNKQPKR